MCGLYGMMGPEFTVQDLGFINNLAYVSGLRGLDSAGLLQGIVRKNNHPRWPKTTYTVEKVNGDISYFMWYHSTAKEGDREILNSVTDNFMAGHNRYATRGKVSLDNAHPFEIDNIVGMHNGTLKNTKYSHPNKTDSQLLFEDISERGLSTVLKELNSDDHYAVVVFEPKTGIFHFARNDGRPLFFAINKERKVLYWASERDFLELCARRNGIKIETFLSMSSGFIHSLSPHDVEIAKRPSWKVKRIEEIKTEIFFPSNQNRIGSSVIPWNPPGEGGGRREIKEAKTDEKLSEKTKALFKKCLWCENSLSPLDQKDAVPVENEGFICTPCIELKQEVAVH